MRTDAVVLGAGIVGVSVALHLQARGRSVVLVDRRGAGEETSFGNGGLIQREGVYPYGFPRDIGTLLRIGLNRSVDARYHASALFELAPFLWQYWKNSEPARHAVIARHYSRLIEHCISEHDALAAEAGAEDLLRRRGWMRVFRTARERELRFKEAAAWRAEFGIKFSALNEKELQEKEPHLTRVLVGALHWTDPVSVIDPQGLTLAYLKLFESRGGRFLQGNADSLEQQREGWSVSTVAGPLQCASAVIALGPWSDAATRRLGYALPLAVKRGYCMHYHAAGKAVLNHTIVDSERGYALVPTLRGVRLTTGAEFALRDAIRTPVQLGRAEPLARGLFPLAERLDNEPWMGSRPCTPDMLPIIGKAPRHADLWFAFGHAHHGLTLGPVTGRLIGEMVAGETPFVDPAPYRPGRF